jgi:hypothetical protein
LDEIERAHFTIEFLKCLFCCLSSHLNFFYYNEFNLVLLQFKQLGVELGMRGRGGKFCIDGPEEGISIGLGWSQNT